MLVHRGPSAPAFEVDVIASRLEGFEETIISKIIDRAQFCMNETVYTAGQSGFEGENDRSLFHIRLLHQERMDAQFGRFLVPEERPFNRRLPSPKRTLVIPDTGLHVNSINSINLTPELVEAYCALVPRICRKGDDGHYGSSVEHDVYAVQAIARRVHYGSLYVAESKFRNAPDVFSRLIEKKDEGAIVHRLTRKDVERRILERVRRKIRIAESNANPAVRHLVDPDVLVDFFRDTVIPLTKKGETLYLLNRRI